MIPFELFLPLGDFQWPPICCFTITLPSSQEIIHSATTQQFQCSRALWPLTLWRPNRLIFWRSCHRQIFPSPHHPRPIQINDGHFSKPKVALQCLRRRFWEKTKHLMPLLMKVTRVPTPTMKNLHQVKRRNQRPGKW